MTIPGMSDTMTDATHHTEVGEYIVACYYQEIGSFLRACVCITPAHVLNLSSLKISEGFFFCFCFILHTPILWKMAGKTTNQTCQGSNLD